MHNFTRSLLLFLFALLSWNSAHAQSTADSTTVFEAAYPAQKWRKNTLPQEITILSGAMVYSDNFLMQLPKNASFKLTLPTPSVAGTTFYFETHNTNAKYSQRAVELTCTGDGVNTTQRIVLLERKHEVSQRLVVLPTGTKTITFTYASDGKAVNLHVLRVVAPTHAPTAQLPLTLTSAGYATLYAPFPALVPTGVKAHIITAANEGKLTLVDLAQAGQVIPANTAVLISGTPGQYTFAESSATAVAAPTTNLLRGVTAEEVISSETEYLYKLANDPTSGIGFYWDDDAGNAAIIPANRAYLALPQSSSTATQGFALGTLSALRQLNSPSLSTQDAPIYDLSGRRLSRSQRGLLLIGGQKVLR